MDQQIPTSSLLQVIRFALENPNILTGGHVPAIRVKDLKICNGITLMCEYHSDYHKTTDIKGEMVIVLGCFNGFFRAGDFEGWKFPSYAVSALDPEGNELMYCVCSKQTSELLGTGDSISWLKNAYFQENTADFRLSRAKTIISDIEKSMRLAIAQTLQQKFGAAWWTSAIPSNIRNQVEDIYQNQFGSLPADQSLLMDYTYTMALKKIISADWGIFKNLFDSKQDFEDTMTHLNEIRREEAHNRAISHRHLVDLEKIYKLLLGKMALQIPGIELVYVLQNWRSRIKEIMVTTKYTAAYTQEEFENADQLKRVSLIKKDTESVIEFAEMLLLKLNSIEIPLTKEKLHTKLVELIEEHLQLHKRKLEMYKTFSTEGLTELLEEIKKQKQEMDIFSHDFLISES